MFDWQDKLGCAILLGFCSLERFCFISGKQLSRHFWQPECPYFPLTLWLSWHLTLITWFTLFLGPQVKTLSDCHKIHCFKKCGGIELSPTWRNFQEKSTFQNRLKFSRRMPRLLPIVVILEWCKAFLVVLHIWSWRCFNSTLDAYGTCEIIPIPEKFETKPYAFGFQKNSPYVDIFNYYLGQLRETGALHKLKSKYVKKEPACPNTAGLPIGFANSISAFLVLSFGLGLGLALLMLENAYFRFRVVEWLHLSKQH